MFKVQSMIQMFLSSFIRLIVNVSGILCNLNESNGRVKGLDHSGIFTCIYIRQKWVRLLIHCVYVLLYHSLRSNQSCL